MSDAYNVIFMDEETVCLNGREYAELTMHFIVKQVALLMLDLSKESVKCLMQNHKE